jgi:putative phosphoserine phosphatase/1-acylglycerol-3-phosphate O-acyltransferase
MSRNGPRDFAGNHGIDLGSSYSCGNNGADSAILSMVGNPVAVEPTRRLESMAVARGWKIINQG